MTFSEPILRQPVILNGHYRARVEGLVSELKIEKRNVWGADGLRAAQVTIERQSTITGRLTIATHLLLNEHEYVATTHRLPNEHDLATEQPPDHELLKIVLQVLQLNDIDLLQIEQSAPRLDPAGSLRTQLCTWSIHGRGYQASTLSAMDIHLVIAGEQPVLPGATTQPTTIDIRVRCLHDPRDAATPQRASLLAAALRSDLKRLLPLPSPLPAASP